MRGYVCLKSFVRNLRSCSSITSKIRYSLDKKVVGSRNENGESQMRQVCGRDQIYWNVNPHRWMSQQPGLGFDDLDNIEEEFHDDLILDESEYNNLVQDSFGVPFGGHKVFVVQPFILDKSYNDHTTGELQLEESISLIKSVQDWKVVGSKIVVIKRQNRKLLLGRNQLTKLKESIDDLGNVSAVFMSVDVLLRSQLKELQKQLGLTVFDRYSVVIRIFKDHAKTPEAKLQVSLSEVFFLRSRLDEVHEGRDPTNAKLMGGTGQTFLQARKVLLSRRERKLKAQIEKLKEQRNKLREGRVKRKIPSVAVIGYTNSGKTTLIKALTGDKRMVPEDQLFATLDVTVHAGYLPNTMRALFVDTVGFISNIPRTLMEAFTSTLEDAISADLVIHVEDVSNPDNKLQRENVLTTVQSMLSTQQLETMIHIGNKIDKADISGIERDANTVYVSAVTGLGLDVLREEIQDRLLHNTGFLQKRVRIPLSGDHLSYLYKEATVVSTERDISEENLIVNIVISSDNYEKFKHRYGKR